MTWQTGVSLMAAIAVVSTSLDAQQRSAHGIVVDTASGKTMAGAYAYVGRAISEQRTGKDGKFSVEGVSYDPFFVVRVAGYVPAKVPWTAVDSAGNAGMVRLRKAKTEQDRFDVQAEDLRVYPQLAKFYQRKNEVRQGYYLTPDEVALRGTMALYDVIRTMGGLGKLCMVNKQGAADCGRSYRGPTTITNTPAEEEICLANVWYYGLNGPSHPNIADVRMDEVVALEGYERPGSTPSEFKEAECGAIVLWMKSVVER